VNYRRFGKTELLVSEVGLGALGAAYGIGQESGVVPSEQEAMEVFRAAVKAGITLFDTAGAYGLSERRIGKFLRATGSKLVITTKLAVRPSGDGRWLDYATERAFPTVRACVDHQVEKSLRNLGVEAIDVEQLHGVPDGAVFDELTEALEANVAAGKIRFLGASCGGADVPRLIEAGCYSTVQLCYSMLDQTERSTGLRLAKEHDLGVLVRTPLALGVLADKLERLDGERRARFGPFLDELRSRLPEGMSVPEAALRFVLSSPEVSSVIPGSKRASHVLENARAGDGRGLPRELHAYLCGLADAGKLPKWSWFEHYQRDWPGGAKEKNLALCRSVDFDE